MNIEESILTNFADSSHEVVITVAKNKEGEIVFTAGSAFIKTGNIARRRTWMHSKLDEWIDEQLTKEQA
jgi:hypothetical protein